MQTCPARPRQRTVVQAGGDELDISLGASLERRQIAEENQHGRFATLHDDRTRREIRKREPLSDADSCCAGFLWNCSNCDQLSVGGHPRPVPWVTHMPLTSERYAYAGSGSEPYRLARLCDGQRRRLLSQRELYRHRQRRGPGGYYPVLRRGARRNPETGSLPSFDHRRAGRLRKRSHLPANPLASRRRACARRPYRRKLDSIDSNVGLEELFDPVSPFDLPLRVLIWGHRTRGPDASCRRSRRMNQRRCAIGNFAACLTGGLLVVLASLEGVALSDQRTERQPAGRPSNELSIEAESLVGSAEQPIQGQVSVQNMQAFGRGWGGGAQLFWGGAQNGAQLRISFPTAVTGRYEIFLHFTRGPDFAVVRASLDGASAATFDGYAPMVSRDRVSLGIRDLTPGSHKLRLEVTAKDGKSAGFNVGLDRIELQPVLEQSTSRDRPGGGGQTAAAVPGGTTIPVLHVPRGSSSRDDSPAQATIPPLPMSARIEMVQKALSSTSTPLGQAGTPIRLSAAVPRRDLSGLTVINGGMNAWSERNPASDPKATLDLYFDPVEPNRPHLLECACYIGWSEKPVPVRVSANISDQKYVELSVITLSW